MFWVFQKWYKGFQGKQEQVGAEGGSLHNWQAVVGKWPSRNQYNNVCPWAKHSQAELGKKLGELRAGAVVVRHGGTGTWQVESVLAVGHGCWLKGQGVPAPVGLDKDPRIMVGVFLPCMWLEVWWQVGEAMAVGCGAQGGAGWQERHLLGMGWVLQAGCTQVGRQGYESC